MDSKEYAATSDRLARGVNALGGTASRKTRRNQAANLAWAHKKQARKDWFKKFRSNDEGS